MIWNKKLNFLIFSIFLFLLLIFIFLYFFIDRRPLVSVVMPVYNRVSLLPRSIESILNQTYDKFEFIIVDDGSTDGSANLIRAYQKLDSRIKLVQNEQNRGISFSRNRGTDLAKGKYVCIMDSDDFSESTRIEKHVQYLEQHPDVTALNALYYEMGREHKGINNWVPPHRLDIIFNLKNYFTNIAFFRIDFVRKHNIRYDEKIMSSEDYDFWSKIYITGGKLRMLNQQLIRLRRHSSNSDEYYEQIRLNARKISDRLLSRFGFDPSNLKTDCERLGQMVLHNPQAKIVDQYVLELTYNRQCRKQYPVKGSYYVKHTDFVDYILPTDDPNIFKRRKTGEIFKFLGVKNGLHSFERSDGTVEMYNIQKDKSLALQFNTDN